MSDWTHNCTGMSCTVTGCENKPKPNAPCRDFAPRWFAGRWRDWHRGHGCNLDDGKPRTPEGEAEIAARRGLK